MDEIVVRTIRNCSANFKTKDFSWGKKHVPRPDRFEVCFDSPDRIYFPDQIISGKVLLQITDPINVKGIKMRFKGECSLHFYDTKTIISRKKKDRTKDLELEVKRPYMRSDPTHSAPSDFGTTFLENGFGNPGYVSEVDWQKENESAFIYSKNLGTDSFVERVLPMPTKTPKIVNKNCENRPKSTTSNIWKEGTMKGPRQHYHAMETYFDCEFYIYGHKYQKQEKELLSPGIHVFPFAFNLPPNLPNSFSSDRGIIRYTATAIIDRPAALDIVRKTGFSVHSILDINMDQHGSSSCRCSNAINLCGLCCQTGPITASLLLPRTSYVPGEIIQISAEVDNISGRTIRGSRLIFSQILTLKMPNNLKTRIEERKIEEIQRGELSPGETEFWKNVEIVIPPVAPSNIHITCRLMTLHYKIEMIVEMPRPWKNIIISIPINIGSIPLISKFSSLTSPTNIERQPPLPGFKYNNFPTYFFRECFFGKRYLEEQYEEINDDKEYMGHPYVEKTPFAPTYIVYKPINTPHRNASTSTESFSLTSNDVQ